MSLITTQQALEFLQRGDVVALPTETVYGLAARINSESALKKIFAVKQRPFFDPLIVHVANQNSARDLCTQWPEIYQALSAEFWPGPLTLVAPKAAHVSDLITASLDSVAVRCPQHQLTLDVINRLGVPLAAPSANRFGHTSPTEAQHVECEFLGQVAVVDGGSCGVGVESTVLTFTELSGTYHLQVLRPGGVSRVVLRDFLQRTKIPFTLTRATSTAAPGQLKAHYQPPSPLIILRAQNWNPTVQRHVENALGHSLISHRELQLPSTPQEAARRLYGLLRSLSTDQNQALWVRQPSAIDEHWETIWDRLERASTVQL